jgi:release factor glutamine methyltransferase
MTLREALLGARERLRASGSEEPEIEAEVLLRYALGLDRNMLLRLLNEPVSDAELSAYERVLMRRLRGEPAAYITGCREFRGLNFKVTPATLIPRPETEMLVDEVLGFIRRRADAGRETVVADVGTGSGAIAVSIAKWAPSSLIYATDLSAEALQIARENARTHGVLSRLILRRGDLLEPIDARLIVISANLPYVTTQDWERLPRQIREHEPRMALDGGREGLDVIRRLLRQAPAYLRPGGRVLLEFGAGQGDPMQAAARENFPTARISLREDFAAIPRLLIIET